VLKGEKHVEKRLGDIERFGGTHTGNAAKVAEAPRFWGAERPLQTVF
jgi:hypothetical protein